MLVIEPGLIIEAPICSNALQLQLLRKVLLVGTVDIVTVEQERRRDVAEIGYLEIGREEIRLRSCLYVENDAIFLIVM
jgi:hypothetical protein